MADAAPKIPKVGVIIAHKNYNAWIQECVISAAQSDYPDVEIYVGDDASEAEPSFNFEEHTIGFLLDPNSDVKARKLYRAYGHKVHYVGYKESRGPSYVRNRLIERAVKDGCEVVAILDSDDVIYPTKISKCVAKIIEGNGLVAAAYTDYFIQDTQFNIATYESKAPYDRAALMQSCIIHSGCVINVEALKRVGLYDEELRTCEDYDLWLRMSDYFSFTHIAEPLVMVRNHPQNSTSTVSQERWQQDMGRVRQKCMARYGG